MVMKLSGGNSTQCFLPSCDETVYRESAYLHQGRLFCSDTHQQQYDADMAGACKICDRQILATSEYCDSHKPSSMTISTTPEEKEAAVERSRRAGDIKPDYYHTDSVYEPFKIIRYYGLNFFTGSALKYLVRAGKKSPDTHKQDLIKARTFINSEIEELEKEK